MVKWILSLISIVHAQQVTITICGHTGQRYECETITEQNNQNQQPLVFDYPQLNFTPVIDTSSFSGEEKEIVNNLVDENFFEED